MSLLDEEAHPSYECIYCRRKLFSRQAWLVHEARHEQQIDADYQDDSGYER